MVARFVALACMGRLHFWHGRWGTLLVGGTAMVGGLGLVFLGGNLPTIVAGLFLFGTGTGITYFAALYYSMAVGHAAVDAGGGFEALIGAGYCLGPVLGLLGQALAADQARARELTVLLTWAAAALFVGRAAPPYFAARRARR
jgi:hypothetical protein